MASRPPNPAKGRACRPPALAVTHIPDPRQVSLLPPEAASMLHLVRENLRLLAELVQRYEVSRITLPGTQIAIRTPSDVAAYLAPEMADLDQEQLRVVLLNTKNQVLGIFLVAQGSLNVTAVRFADCFREAVRVNAAAVVFVHNHPSRQSSPSSEDVAMTAEAARAGELLGIEVLDHIVIGGSGHASLRELGLYHPAKHGGL